MLPARNLPGTFFQAGHIPSWRGSCELYALSPAAAGSRWLLLLLSPLLSAAGPSSSHLLAMPGGLPRQTMRRCPGR